MSSIRENLLSLTLCKVFFSNSPFLFFYLFFFASIGFYSFLSTFIQAFFLVFSLILAQIQSKSKTSRVNYAAVNVNFNFNSLEVITLMMTTFQQFARMIFPYGNDNITTAMSTVTGRLLCAEFVLLLLPSIQMTLFDGAHCTFYTYIHLICPAHGGTWSMKQ